MKKNFKIAAILMIIAAVCGLAVSGMNKVTSGIIEKNQLKKEEVLCKEIFSDFSIDNSEIIKEFENEASAEARNYAVIGGVAKAVQTQIPEDFPIHPVIIDGLTKQSIRDLKKYAKAGLCELGNLIEVMCCEGGCIAGPGCIALAKKASRQVEAYVEKGQNQKDMK